MLEALKSLKNSKTLQSELMILQEHSIIKESDDYISVRSLTNPHFHWGNFLIFDRAPKAHDISLWEEYFCREFPEFVHQHRAFTWIEGDDIPTFVPPGYHLEKMVCLTAKDVQHVKQINSDVSLRRICSEEEWRELERKQIARLKSEDRDISFVKFTKQRLKDYRSLIEKQLGDWFVADYQGEWVGDLGVFYGEGMGRYQKITTYPGFEGHGIAHALVYASAKFVLKHYPVEELVIVADENSRAQKIYQNLDFKQVEKRVNFYRAISKE